jgi:hypothetical protein
MLLLGLSDSAGGVTMHQVVHVGAEFTCPYCAARYTLELEDGTPVLGVLGERLCAHLDREVLPASPAGDVWEVYFAEPEPERD